MFTYLEQLRHKPLNYRKRVALVVAACVTGAIVLVWLSTFRAGLDSVDPGALEKELGPLEVLTENFSRFYSSAKELSGSVFGGVSTSSPQ